MDEALTRLVGELAELQIEERRLTAGLREAERRCDEARKLAARKNQEMLEHIYGHVAEVRDQITTDRIEGDLTIAERLEAEL